MIEIVPNWHPLFVHFTVALLSLSVLIFIVQRPLAETEIGDNLLIFARYSLGFGILFTVLTVVAGIDAYNTVDHDTPSHIAMKDHRLWALITAVTFLVAWIWSLLSLKGADKAGIALIVILLLGGGLLVTTGHKGSLLVYYYGLGVESLPEADEHDHSGHDHEGHSHSHDAGTEHSHDAGAEHQHDTATPNEHDETENHEHNHEHDASAQNKDMSSNTMSADEHERSDDHEHSHEHDHAAEEQKTEVTVDNDGIVRESLPAVDIPVQKE